MSCLWTSFQGLILLAGLSCSPGTVYAAIDTYQWHLTATVDVTASIAGKTIKLKKQPLSALDAIFENNQQFVMGNSQWQLAGTWSQKKSRFQLRLNDDSVKQLLSIVERDLLAQSNLGAKLSPKSHQGNGSEKTSQTPLIEGRLPIKATLAFPAYATKTGSLTLDIHFTGRPSPLSP